MGLGRPVSTIALFIVPQAFVGALPWWYYRFRIGMGYEEQMDMRWIDVITFTILAACALVAWRQLRPTAPSRVFRFGLLLLHAVALFLCAVVAWAFIFVPYVPASFPPWTTGTTLATTLRVIAPFTALIAVVSFAATLIHVFTTRTRAA